MHGAVVLVVRWEARTDEIALDFATLRCLYPLQLRLLQRIEGLRIGGRWVVFIAFLIHLVYF